MKELVYIFLFIIVLFVVACGVVSTIEYNKNKTFIKCLETGAPVHECRMAIYRDR